MKKLKILLYPICFIRGIIRNLLWWSIPDGFNVYSGHNFISQYEGFESAFHDLECEICGIVSKGENSENL